MSVQGRATDKKTALLQGRTLINLFFEASTRTQSSFELAGKRLGADVMNMSVKTSSVSKGETLLDTATTLNAMRPDILVVRHQDAGAAELLSRKLDCSVINAGDGAHEHPTQALLDALTIRRHRGSVRRPDRRHLRRRAAQPGGALQPAPAVDDGRAGAAGGAAHPAAVAGRPLRGRDLSPTCSAGLAGADIVMMLRLQLERMAGAFVPSTREYFRFYGLDREKLAYAKPGALVMHPGPDEPRRGDRLRHRRRCAGQPDRRTGGDGRRHPHGDPGCPCRGGWHERRGRIAFRNARLIDPASGLDAKGGLLVENGRIADVGPRLFNDAEPNDPEVIDCRGLVLAPGLIDCPRLHRRAGRRASRKPGIGQCRGGGRRRHLHGRDAQHRSGDRRAFAGGFPPAPRRRHRQGARAAHRRPDQGPCWARP